MAFVWDEGFHLVAAQLIAAGKTPYVDFIFPQTLLNAYFNAAIIHFFGNSWRAIHVFDAIFIAASFALTADYVYRRIPEERWKFPAALVAGALVGFDTVIVPFGPIAQAYAIGTALCVGAFRVAVNAVRASSVWLAGLAGLLCGCAAGSTLLCAPVAVVLLVWIVWSNAGGSRLAKVIAFCVGAIIPFAPELWLLAKAPRQTIFNVIEYQALFRRVNWGDAAAHDFDVFLDWTVSTSTLLRATLFVLGVYYLRKHSPWPRELNKEFYLAAAIALALCLYIATAHPTFGRYFIFAIPFLAIVAAPGFVYVGSRLGSPDAPWWPTVIALFLLGAALTKYLFDDRQATTWKDLEKIAAKVKQVTPPHGEYYADEMVYFLLKQAPPSGMEFSYSHKLQLSAAEEKLYHIISLDELKKQVASGRFDTVETCKDEIMEDWKLDELFPHKQEFEDCTVYWRRTDVAPDPPEKKKSK